LVDFSLYLPNPNETLRNDVGQAFSNGTLMLFFSISKSILSPEESLKNVDYWRLISRIHDRKSEN